VANACILRASSSSPEGGAWYSVVRAFVTKKREYYF